MKGFAEIKKHVSHVSDAKRGPRQNISLHNLG
jgi:hypothetical protein